MNANVTMRLLGVIPITATVHSEFAAAHSFMPMTGYDNSC